VDSVLFVKMKRTPSRALCKFILMIRYGAFQYGISFIQSQQVTALSASFQSVKPKVNTPSTKSLFIFGFGNVGKCVAELASDIYFEELGADGFENSKEVYGLRLENREEAVVKQRSVLPRLTALLGLPTRVEKRSTKTKQAFNRKDRRCVFQSITATTLRQEDIFHSNLFPGEVLNVINFNNATAVEMHLRKATHVLITIPPVMDPNHLDSFVNPVFKANYHRFIGRAQWIGFVSTTGVYGDHQGKWVNEKSALYGCTPPPTLQQSRVTRIGTQSAIKYAASSLKSKAAAYRQVEIQWCNYFGYEQTPSKIFDGKAVVSGSREENTKYELRQIAQVCIFRCAGLYGNSFSALHTLVHKCRQRMKENPILTMMQAIEKLLAEDQVSVKDEMTESYTSRINLLDVSRAIVASMVLDGLVDTEQVANSFDNEAVSVFFNKPLVYNLADNEPEKRSIVMRYALSLLSNEIRSFPNNILFSQTCPEVKQDTQIDKISERSQRRKSDNKRVDNSKMRQILLEPFGGLFYPSYEEGLYDILLQNRNAA